MILCTRGVGEEDRLRRVPGPAGRPAHARRRRQGRGAEDRRHRAVPRAPAAHPRRRGGRSPSEMVGAGRQRAHRRHRRASRARRPARVGAGRPAGGGPPRTRRHHGQPQRRAHRPAAAGGVVRLAHRDARARHARIQLDEFREVGAVIGEALTGGFPDSSAAELAERTRVAGRALPAVPAARRSGGGLSAQETACADR